MQKRKRTLSTKAKILLQREGEGEGEFMRDPGEDAWKFSKGESPFRISHEKKKEWTGF